MPWKCGSQKREHRPLRASHFWSSSFQPPSHYWDRVLQLSISRSSLTSSRLPLSSNKPVQSTSTTTSTASTTTPAKLFSSRMNTYQWRMPVTHTDPQSKSQPPSHGRRQSKTERQHSTRADSKCIPEVPHTCLRATQPLRVVACRHLALQLCARCCHNAGTRGPALVCSECIENKMAPAWQLDDDNNNNNSWSSSASSEEDDDNEGNASDQTNINNIARIGLPRLARSPHDLAARHALRKPSFCGVKSGKVEAVIRTSQDGTTRPCFAYV